MRAANEKRDELCPSSIDLVLVSYGDRNQWTIIKMKDGKGGMVVKSSLADAVVAAARVIANASGVFLNVLDERRKG